MKNIVVLFSLTGMLCLACSDYSDPEVKKYVAEIEEYRAEYNDYMKTNPSSPFNYKGKVEFHDLNYFDVDPDFKFSSKLYEYEKKDTVKVFGTKGEERQYVRYGYVIFTYDDKEYKLNVNEGGNDEKYYIIWFTDKTTNEESYGVGRYLNFEKKVDPEYVYEIDFNKAYNPYCAYSKEYSCAIPTKEDYLDMAITAGEKKFHD